MCRPLRENLHFSGNAMYRTLLEGMWLSGYWVFIPIIYIHLSFALSRTPSGSVRYIVFAIRRISWPYVLRRYSAMRIW